MVCLFAFCFFLPNQGHAGGRCEDTTYTTGLSPSAPPHPIITMAKVMVDMTKLVRVNIGSLHADTILEGGPSSPDKAQRRWIGEALDIIPGMRHFRSKVELSKGLVLLPSRCFEP